MRLCDMFQALVKTREANIAGDELKEARIRMEGRVSDLVKTLDEMLEETLKANRRDFRHEARRESNY